MTGHSFPSVPYCHDHAEMHDAEVSRVRSRQRVKTEQPEWLGFLYLALPVALAIIGRQLSKGQGLWIGLPLGFVTDVAIAMALNGRSRKETADGVPESKRKAQPLAARPFFTQEGSLGMTALQAVWVVYPGRAKPTFRQLMTEPPEPKREPTAETGPITFTFWNPEYARLFRETNGFVTAGEWNAHARNAARPPR